ncbi:MULTISPECIES: erythromycin esterase family protein [unclassified Mycobacterium]|uniref:erythromycin esterase family protein n=1 Tax=unclassified Mycobacterium TaxID=2642494 RepID=UPI001482ED50|nr:MULTISPECIES: erythromycin esterase family protein [unclassified Mycobacterium]
MTFEVDIDAFLSGLSTPPRLLGIGEPTHGPQEFGHLRNRLLRHLVAERGFRSVAVESDAVAGFAVNRYVTTGEGTLEDVLDAGFSHGFGAYAASRELVEWLRDWNVGREPGEQVRFYGFDATTEMMASPSPRDTLLAVHRYLSTGGAVLPYSEDVITDLVGDDAAWSHPDAMIDAAVSIGRSAPARQLRLIADELVVALERYAPALRASTSPEQFWQMCTVARAAVGLLRAHFAMADPGPSRMSTMLGVRDALMAENLEAIADAEIHSGPTLVFAHNGHLQRHQTTVSMGSVQSSWWCAGALVASAGRVPYAVIAGDFGTHESADIGAPHADTLHGWMWSWGPDRILFPVTEIPGGLSPRQDVPPRSGCYPVDPADVEGVDAIAFIRSLTAW